MKLTKSFFSVSPALIIENIKQFWPISLVGFMLFFIAGPFPIMVSVDGYSRDNMVTETLANCSIVYIPVLVVLAIASSVAVFKYLHTTTAATVMHSMPFSRGRLMGSSIVSGLIIIAIPIILNGLILASMAGIGAFAWMLDAFIIVLFIYSISAIAGVIAGTVFVHTLLALLLNYIVPILIYFTQRYMESFLEGYNGGPFFRTVYSYLSPIAFRTNSGHAIDSSEWWIQLIFIIASLLFLSLAYLAYRKVKLEKEGNGMVFKTVADVISMLVAFIGMTALGYYLRSMSDTDNEMAYFFAGCVVGSLLFFIICRMIIERTVNIFNKPNFVRYGIFAVIALVFLAFTVFDITGFEKRVPEKDNIAYVTVEQMDGLAVYDEKNPSSERARFDDESSITTVLELHNTIIAEDLPTPYNAYIADEKYTTDAITFTYYLKNGKRISRDYLIWMTPEAVKQISSLYESDDNKSAGLFRGMTAKDIEKIRISDLGYYSTEKIPSKLYSDLMEAMNKDYENRLYKDINVDNVLCSLDFNERGMEVREKDTNTVRFLREHGYSDYLDNTFADNALDAAEAEKYGY